MPSSIPHTHFAFRLKGIALTVTFIWVLVALSAGAGSEELPSMSVTVKGHHLLVDVAATPSARKRGLSRRTSLPEHQGMLFVYPTPRPLSFWMKDTEIPLSIAFLDDTGRILSIRKMVPMQTNERYASPCPARYALEVNQGWFARHAIDAGDIVEMQIPQLLDIR